MRERKNAREEDEVIALVRHAQESKVFFIGGSVCAGKTTLAKQLCASRCFRHFCIDDRLGEYAAMGIADGKRICRKHEKMRAEEFWMRDPALQCAELVERFTNRVSESGAIH